MLCFYKRLDLFVHTFSIQHVLVEQLARGSGLAELVA